MRKVATLFTALCLAFGLVSGAAATSWQEISAPELKAKMDAKEVLVIYPLSRIEYRNLHIVGDVNIPMSELKEKLPADKNQTIAFYCLGRK